MNNSDQQGNHGLQVAPSPFNAVKLELAIIVVAAIVLFALVDSITTSDSTQIGILLFFGFCSSLWLIIRTRYLFRRISKN